MNDNEFRNGNQSRRAFVRNGSLFLLGAGIGWSDVSALFGDEAKRSVRVGLVTDMHYADKPAAGSRHYRETLAKLEEAAQQFQKDQPQLVIELGDFIDAAESLEAEKGYLKRINKDFAALPGEKHYVLGNHCVQTLTKAEFLEGVDGRQDKPHYSFDVGGFHFVILDACYRSDGQPYGRKNFEWTDANIPAHQVEWLEGELQATAGKVIVFVHQRLDVSNHYGVKNGAQVRKVLEDSGKVLAVFQGHNHKNDLRDINGIHYCTLAAMVEGSGTENNAYATMDLLQEGAVRITGFRKQRSCNWT